MSKASAQKPILLSLAMVIGGLVLGFLGGGYLIGAIIAGCGIVPAAWGAWAGMQQETQGGLAGALGMVFLAVGVCALLVVLQVVNWVL